MSKKFGLLMVLVIVLAMLAPFVCFADNTGGAGWDNDLGGFNGIRNYVGGHGHEYANTQRAKRFAVGVGVDVIVHERAESQNNLTPLITTLETKWDIANKNGGAYLVATYRLSDMWTGLVDLVGMGK